MIIYIQTSPRVCKNVKIEEINRLKEAASDDVLKTKINC